MGASYALRRQYRWFLELGSTANPFQYCPGLSVKIGIYFFLMLQSYRMEWKMEANNNKHRDARKEPPPILMVWNEWDVVNLNYNCPIQRSVGARLSSQRLFST